MCNVSVNVSECVQVEDVYKTKQNLYIHNTHKHTDWLDQVGVDLLENICQWVISRFE